MARKSRGVVKRASVLLKRAVRKPIDALQAKARARRMALYEKLGIEMEKLFKEHPDRGSKFMEALERLPREMAINAALDRRGILGPEKRAKVKGIMEKIAMRGQQIPAERLEARSDLIVDSHLGELAKTLGPIKTNLFFLTFNKLYNDLTEVIEGHLIMDALARKKGRNA